MKKHARLITTWVLVVSILAVITWDFVAQYLGGNPATISGVAIYTLYHHPAMAFAFGALIGHLTWPKTKVRSFAVHMGVVTLSVMVLILLDIYVPFYAHPIGPLLVGIPFGHFAWPQATILERDQFGRFVRLNKNEDAE